MNNNTKRLAAAALATAIASTATAEGLYGTAMLGWSFQANDSEPYGSNIAVDPDFPGQFSADDGGLGAIGIGYVFNERFRIEGRLGFRKADFASTRFGTGARAGEEYTLDGDVKTTSLTVDAFYDIPTSTKIKPYVKAGIGVAKNKYAAKLGGAGVAAFDAFDGTVDGFYDAYSDGDNTHFSWNIGFGASVEVQDGVSLFGEYQYASFGGVSTGQDAFTDGFKIDTDAHEVMFGVRASF